MPSPGGIALPTAIAILGMLALILNLYRLRLDRQGSDLVPEAGSFGAVMPCYREQGASFRSKATSRAVARVSSGIGCAVLLLGYAAGTRSGLDSAPSVAAGAAVLGSGLYTVSHVVWLWRDRRSDAFEMAYSLRPMVPRLYPNEAAVRRLFFGMNPMPLWTVFDRNWHSRLLLPDGPQMLMTNDPVREVLLSGSTFGVTSELTGVE